MNTTTLKTLIPFIFVLLWSTGFLAAKYSLPYIEPFNVLYIRMVITSAVFLLLILIFKAQWPSRKETVYSAISGTLIHGCYLGGVFAAIKWGMPAGISAIIVSLQPIVTAVFSSVFLGAKLGRRQISGLLIGFIGVFGVIAASKNMDNNAINLVGICACLLALLGISIGTLIQKKYCQNTDLLTGAFWQYCATAVFMGVLTNTFENGSILWEKPLILSLIWLVLGLSVSAILLLMVMIREGEAAKVASYFYLVPVTVCIETWILFGEQLNTVAIIAMMIAVFGVYLVISKR